MTETTTTLYLLGNKCAKCATFEIRNARPERVMQPSRIREHGRSETMGHEQMAKSMIPPVRPLIMSEPLGS